MPAFEQEQAPEEVAAGIESALDALMGTLSGTAQETLKSKILLLQLSRDESVATETARIVQSQAAKSAFHSGQIIKLCWDMAKAQAEQTSDALISACLEVGGRFDDQITTYVALELKGFLRSYVAERTQRGDASDGQNWAQGASLFAAEASDRASRVSHRVRSRRHDFDRGPGTVLERATEALTNRPVTAFSVLKFLLNFFKTLISEAPQEQGVSPVMNSAATKSTHTTDQKAVLEEETTRSDRLKAWFKNNRVVAPMVVVIPAVAVLLGVVKGVTELFGTTKGPATASAEQPKPWPAATAWIFVGYYDASAKHYREGPYSVVARSPYEDASVLPRLGDSLQVIKERQLIIAGFRKSGTARLFDPPWNVDYLQDSDYIGIHLPVGARVLVRDVSLGSFPGRPAAVWARVAPE